MQETPIFDALLEEHPEVKLEPPRKPPLRLLLDLSDPTVWEVPK